MKLFGSEFHGFIKAIVVLIAVMLVSVGLCGMGAAGYAVAPPPLRVFLAATLGLGAIGFWGASLAIPLVLVIWGVWAMMGKGAKPSRNEDQETPENRDDTPPDGKD